MLERAAEGIHIVGCLHMAHCIPHYSTTKCLYPSNEVYLFGG